MRQPSCMNWLGLRKCRNCSQNAWGWKAAEVKAAVVEAAADTKKVRKKCCFVDILGCSGSHTP